MTDLTDQLDRIIQKAALDGALTKEAVDQFHKILTENSSLLEEVDDLKGKNVAGSKELEACKVKMEDFRAKVTDWVTREKELSEREKFITTLTLTAEHEAKRVQDHINMFTTVFRNSVLRKEVMTPLEATRMDQGMQGQGGYAQKDSVEEEER